MKDLLGAISGVLTVWIAYGIIFDDFDDRFLIAMVMGIIVGYSAGKKQKA
ncbi:hypothetical protein [Halobacillus salinus]|nr:hypothetical protein [Halobacillus salinus]